ncbi:MAG: hypothetical protein LBJ22_05390, partial [Synergistaceae bacterium]|nr:hypothetical protein [Synergistaceae bacterium]
LFTTRELYADGKTPLATSIYSRHIMAAREDTRRNPIVRYAPQITGNGYNQGKIDYVSNGVHIPLTSYPVSADLLPGAKTIRAGQAVGSVIDFFSPASTLELDTQVSTPPSIQTSDTVGYFPVLGSCQSNWLIVFTAANDSDSGFTAAEAATMLFKNSRQMRGRYWNGGQWVEKTHSMDAGVRTMVVGIVDPTETDPLVVGLRNSLNDAAKAGDPISVESLADIDGHGPGFKSNPSAAAYFAADVPHLVASLNAILTRITSGTFAAGSPSVLPQGNDEDSRIVFSATYKVNDYDQWDAWLKKYLVSKDMSMTVEWEFNTDKLVPDLETRGSRVYTTALTSNGKSEKNSALVQDIADADLTALTGVTNHIADFRNWLIQYNNTQILGDSENSNLQIVSSPDIQELKLIPNVDNRPRRVYIQTNRGVLHAIDYENGGEQWAFFPPNVFQTRAKAMKFDQKIAGEPWFEGDGVNVAASEPLSTLDGPLVVADVVTNAEGTDAKTILVGNMGWGGNGLYAMDVTDPSGNNGAPAFLWAVENNRYAGGSSAEVGFWGASADGADMDQYARLGMTIAPTALLKARVSGAADKRNVAFLPGGLGYNLGADDQGKIFYVLLPEDGSILKTFTGGYNIGGPMGNRLGMGIAPTTFIPANTIRSAPQNAAIFTADSEGNVLYCDVTPAVVNWNLKSVFQLRDRVSHAPLAIPNSSGGGVAPVSLGRPVWLFGGSAPLDAPDPDPATGLPRGILNAHNYIFAFNFTKTENFTELNLGDLSRLPYIKENHPALPDFGEDFDSENPEHQPLNPSQITGWYLELRPSQSMIEQGTTVGTRPEYVTTSPYLYNGVLYISTFIPRVRGTDEYEICPDLGHGKLYAIDPLMGKSMWAGDKQAIVLKDIKITGVAAAGGKLYLGVQALSGAALDGLAASGLSISSDGSMVVLDAGVPSPVVPQFSPEHPYIQYWRDIVNP